MENKQNPSVEIQYNSEKYKVQVYPEEKIVKAYLLEDNEELSCYDQFNLYKDNGIKRSLDEIIGMARAYIESKFKQDRRDFKGVEITNQTTLNI